MNQAIPFALSLFWVGAVIAASIVIKRRHGKPIFPRLPQDALFKERKCSGRSHKNLITRIGGASNCLLVAVTDTELIVSPFFPFNLMFLPEIYGFDLRVKRSVIQSVEKKTGRLGTSVLVRFIGDHPAAMELRLARADDFIRACNHKKNWPARAGI
jgi:hypothetical protein